MTDFETELAKNGRIAYTNKGVSMLPLLRQNKDIMVITAQHGGFAVGDAVLFRRTNGQYVMHRITRIHPDGTCYIIGDNCVTGETVPQDRILGVLTEVKKDGKTIRATDPTYRRYVRFLPLRRIILRIRRTLSAPYHRYIKRDR